MLKDRDLKGQFVKGTRPASWRHGMAKTRFWAIFLNIQRRCNDPRTRCYPRYGGRGIRCLWSSFEEFRDEMYESYLAHAREHGEKETTIERMDVNGNYCKENCRWATWREQSANRRDRKPITFRGETKLMTEWAKELGFGVHVIWLRLYRYGWSVEKALTSPLGPTSKRYKKHD